jgi:hypothetical protein
MVFQVLELKSTEGKEMTWKKIQSKMSDDYREKRGFNFYRCARVAYGFMHYNSVI